MNYNIQLRTIPYYFVFNVEASQSGELSWSSKAMRRAPRLNVTSLRRGGPDLQVWGGSAAFLSFQWKA